MILEYLKEYKTAKRQAHLRALAACIPKIRADNGVILVSDSRFQPAVLQVLQV